MEELSRLNVTLVPMNLTEDKVRKVSTQILVDLNDDGIAESDITSDFINIDVNGELESKAVAAVLGKPSVSISNIILDNTDGIYSPNNQSSPIYGQFKKGTKIVINAGFHDSSDNLEKKMNMFTGVITSFKNNVKNGNKRLTIEVKDLAYIAEHQKIPNNDFGWDHYHSGSLPDKIYESCLYNVTLSDVIYYLVEYTYGSAFAAASNIQHTTAVLPVIDLPLDQNVWFIIKKIVETCDARCYFEHEKFNFITPLSADYEYNSSSVYTFNTSNVYDFIETIDENEIINKWVISNREESSQSNSSSLQLRQLITTLPNTNIATVIEDYSAYDDKNALGSDDKTITLKTQSGTTWINTINMPLVDCQTYSDLTYPVTQDMVNAMNAASPIKVFDKNTGKQLAIQDIICGDSSHPAKIILRNVITWYNYRIQIVYQYYTNVVVYGKYKWFEFDLGSVRENIEYPIVEVNNGYSTKTYSNVTSANNLYLSNWEVFDGNRKVKFKLTNNIPIETYNNVVFDKAYVSKCDIYASSSMPSCPLKIIAEDTSNLTYFKNVANINNVYMTDPVFMQRAADLYLYRYNQNRSFLQVNTKFMPQIELADVVDLIDTTAGFNNTYKFYVTAYKHSMKIDGNWKTTINLESLAPAWSYDGTGLRFTSFYVNADKQIINALNIDSHTAPTVFYDGNDVLYKTTLQFNKISTHNISNFVKCEVMYQESINGTFWSSVNTIGSFTDIFKDSFEVTISPDKYYRFYLVASDSNNSKSDLGIGYNIEPIIFPGLPSVENLINYLENGLGVIKWDSINIPNTIYEIRSGSTWEFGTYVTRTSSNKFVCLGNATYWVSGYYNGYYSSMPTSVVVANSISFNNLIANYNERDTKWSGTFNNGIVVSGENLILAGTGLFDDILDLDAVTDLDAYGGVLSSGIYTIPASHIVDIGLAQTCLIGTSYTVKSNPTKTSAKVQINIQQNNLTWNGWQDFVPGQYIGKAFNFRLILMSSDENTTCVVNNFSFWVDVPDVIDSGRNISIPATGATIYYTKTFHEIPTPIVVISIDTVSGDYVKITETTKEYFTVRCYNGGVGVARNISWVSKGY
jgi:hypothetical protein